MKVAMQLITKPGYSTRALKPFYVSEPWARHFERAKAARRIQPEEDLSEFDPMTETRAFGDSNNQPKRRGRPKGSRNKDAADTDR
jgi:hypothetical protein